MRDPEVRHVRGNKDCECADCRRAVRTALFDYLTCKTISAFEGWEEKDDPSDS